MSADGTVRGHGSTPDGCSRAVGGAGRGRAARPDQLDRAIRTAWCRPATPRCRRSARCRTSCSAPALCDDAKVLSRHGQQALADHDDRRRGAGLPRDPNVCSTSPRSGPTGHPHLVAMWYTMVGGNAVFWTFGKSQKIVNLRRDPKMTGLVESGDSYDQLRGVELRGRGVIVDDYDERPRDRQGGRREVQRTVGAGRVGAAVPRSAGHQTGRSRLRDRAHGQLGPHQARRQLLKHRLSGLVWAGRSPSRR